MKYITSFNNNKAKGKWEKIDDISVNALLNALATCKHSTGVWYNSFTERKYNNSTVTIIPLTILYLITLNHVFLLDSDVKTCWVIIRKW